MSKVSLVDASNDPSGVDKVDGEPRRDHLTNEDHSLKAAWYDYLYIGYSCVLYIADVVTDMWVSVIYFRNGDYIWFSLTLLCVVAASLVMMMFSLKWFYEDTDKEVSKIKALIVHILQIGPLKRYWDCYKTGKRSRMKDADRKHYNIYVEQWRDITMLRLFEVFIESAPQLVLQLYILAYNRQFDKENDWLTALSACFSLLSLSSSIVSYSKALRDASVDKGKMTWWAFGCQIVWRLAMVASRVVTLVLFASVYKSWLLLVIGLHWFGMTFWIVRQKPSFCSDNKILKSMYPVVVGFIYMFCFFNVKDGFSRKRLVIFYLIMLVENCALMGLWLPYRHEYGVVFVAALAVVFGGFFLGVIALVLYYQCYHPTLPRQGIFLRTSHDVPPMEGIVDRMICCNTCCRVREESSPPPSSQLHVDIQASRGSLRRDVARVEANASTSPTFESEILIHKPSQLQRQYSLEKERIKKERAEKARRRHSMESSVGRRIAKSAVVHEDDIRNGTLSQPSSLPNEFELSQLGDLEQRNESGLIHRIDTDKPKDTLVGSSDSSRKAGVTYIGNGHDPAVGNSYVTPQESNSYNSVDPQRGLDRNQNASSALEHDKDNKKKTCDDGVHCGTDDEMETKTSCNDGIHCGTDDEKETRPKSFSSVSQSTPNRGRKSFTKSKYHVSDKCTLLDSQVQNTQNPTAQVVRLPKYADKVNFQHRYSIVSDCISLSSSTSSDNEDEGYMETQSTLKDKSSLHDCQGSNVGNKTVDSEQLLERDNLPSNSVECKQKAGSLPSDQDIKRSPKKRSDNRKSRQSNRVSFPNFVATNLKRGRFSSLRRSNEDCTEKSEDTRRHTVDFSLIISGKPSDGTSSSKFSKTLEPENAVRGGTDKKLNLGQ